MPDRQSPDRPPISTWWAAPAVVAAVACCAGPSLLAALGLGAAGAAVGSLLGRPVLVLASVLVLTAAAALIARARTRRAAPRAPRIWRDGQPAVPGRQQPQPTAADGSQPADTPARDPRPDELPEKP